MANLPHIAAKCAEVHPVIAPGLTYTTGLICSGVSLVVGFITGWYVKGRGLMGVKLDLLNAKMDVVNLKEQLNAKVA